MRREYDVIVVGARCAGATTAMLLARAGYTVLLLDRARFPRDTLSTLYIHQPGVALLARWGLLDQVLATGCPAVDSAVYQVADVRLEGCSWPVDGIRAAYAPRRHLLDRILVDGAVTAGAEFRDGCGVEDLIRDGERVTGVRCRAGSARARLVVGADGMRSTVAARAGARTLTERAPMTCVYYSFWAGVPTRFEAYGAAGGWAGSVPTNDGLTLVAAYFPQARFGAIRPDAARAYRDGIRAVAPDLAGRLDAGTQVERLYGTGEQRNFFRQAAGPGWALVGDAGHHKDSITARGITDAFRQAVLLADCLGDGVRDEDRLGTGLRRYATARNGAMLDGYRDTLAAAELRPERRLASLRAIAADPALVERFFARLAGACPVDGTGSPGPARARPHPRRTAWTGPSTST